MYQEERLYKILEVLNDRERLSTNDIVEIFGVSRDTARRDIVKLAEQGSVQRTHGGITLPKYGDLRQFYELRLDDKVSEKKSIAKYAAKLLRENDVCYFDGSTTVAQVCNFCRKDIEIYSNSIHNVSILDKRECEVYVIGGKIAHKNKFIYGYEAVEQIKNVSYDIAFLGADAIRNGCMYSYEKEDVPTKCAVVESADRVFVLVDSSKFQCKPSYRCFSIDKLEAIITDKNPGEDIVEEIEKSGCKLIIVDEE